MSTATAGTGAGKWAGFALVLALLVAVLVWAGTQRAVDAARPADLAYMTKHKGKPGVKTTPSGLQ